MLSRTLALALILMLLLGCQGSTKEEVVRLTSPDKAIDAVLLEGSGGATTTYTYEIHLVVAAKKVSGEPALKLVGAARSEKSYGVNLRWESATILSIEFLSAKSIQENGKVFPVGSSNVSLRLRPGVVDLVAPAGGMYFNLQSRPRPNEPK